MNKRNQSDCVIVRFLIKKPWNDRLLFFLPVIFFISSQLIARQNSIYQNPVEFEHYTTEEGLAHNSVNCIEQDKTGFLWIGSNTGVERFDGYSFTVYKPQKDDSNSLKGTIVWALYTDTCDDLWIGTFNGGLSKYNREQDNFTNYLNNPKNPKSISNDNVSCIFQDISGRFWVATKGGGINLFDRKRSEFIRFMHSPDNPNSIRNNIIHHYCIDKDGLIWLGTESGISILNPETMQFRNYYHKPGDLDQLNDIPVLSVSYIKNGEIWIGSWRKGLFRFMMKTGIMNNYQYSFNVTGSIGGNIVWDICQDSFGEVWIGTDKGLHRFIEADDNFVRYLSDPSDNKSLSEDFVRVIFEDRNWSLWVGTNNGGLNKLNLNRKKFNQFTYKKNDLSGISCLSILSVCEDDKGQIWLGTCEGLNLFDKKNRTFKNFLCDPGRKSGEFVDDINALAFGKQPFLWIGTDLGINRFDLKTHKFFNYRHEPGNRNSLSNNSVFYLYFDASGVLWIGTWGGGLDKFEPDKGIFTNFPIDSHTPSSNVVICIMEDKHNNLWLGTYGHGLVKFDKITHHFTYFEANPDDPDKLKDNVVLYIHQRNDNELWVATAGAGLAVFYPDNGKFHSYNLQDGLPAIEVKGILEDQEKNLWISTGKGISKVKFLHTENDKFPKLSFINFDIKDGLQSNVFNFGACLKSKSGEMYFGGINGFNVFYPDSIKLNPYPSNVLISNFFILYKPVSRGEKINGRIILTKPISQTKEITLSHNEYIFSIEFTALHFADPSKNLYIYKLEGFDKEWIKTDAKRRFVTYSNLKPGKYIFRVKASNNDGIWNEKDTSLTLIILPPWWQTWWFRILFAVFIIAVIYLFYIIRFNKMRKQRIYLEEKISEGTSELRSANIDLTEKQEEIKRQNEELENHRNHLEILVKDRTHELESALKKAEESDKLKTSFLANMSHEIRTPMNAIVGFSSLLKNQNLSKKEKSDFIDIINKNCDSLLVLINDILDISKIEVNQLDIIKHPFSVNKILSELEHFYRMKSPAGIKINFTKQVGNLVLENDPTRFRQIFNNLLVNALKFTEKGHIHFGYEIYNDHIVCFVSDTGIGIEKSQFDNIFNPFVKLENDISKFYGGTGLGLAICKSLIDHMGGKIWVESEIGQGSTFYFTLPYKDQLLKNISSVDVGEKITSVNWQNINILIAEDDENAYLFLKHALLPTGATIYWAKDGQESVEFIRQNQKYHINLVLMDIKMPNLNGINAFQAIQKIDKSIPVLAQTAYAQENEKYDALQLGFTDYLIKPILPQVLINTIQQYI